MRENAAWMKEAELVVDDEVVVVDEVVVDEVVVDEVVVEVADDDEVDLGEEHGSSGGGMVFVLSQFLLANMVGSI